MKEGIRAGGLIISAVAVMFTRWQPPKPND